MKPVLVVNISTAVAGVVLNLLIMMRLWDARLDDIRYTAIENILHSLVAEGGLIGGIQDAIDDMQREIDATAKTQGASLELLDKLSEVKSPARRPGRNPRL